jgi:hypothetical protein
MFFNNRIADADTDTDADAITDDPLDDLLHTTYISECANLQTCTYLFLLISVVSVIVIFRK